MEIIDNINHLLGDNLKQTLMPGAKLKIAASCFSIYAFEALKTELEKIELLEFIFTTPTFVPAEATDKVKKERREFHIPRLERERDFYGTNPARHRTRMCRLDTSQSSLPLQSGIGAHAAVRLRQHCAFRCRVYADPRFYSR